MYMSTQNGCSLATFLIETESRDIWANSKQNMAVMASDGPSPHSPCLHLGQPGPPAIETPPHPVPHGPLISWFKNASCSRIPPQASYAPLPLWRWATTCCRLSLHPCIAPPSCSLQHLLKLSLLSLRPSLLQLSQSFHFFCMTEVRSLDLCVCFHLFLFCLCFSGRNKLQLQVPVCNLVVITTAIALLLLP